MPEVRLLALCVFFDRRKPCFRDRGQDVTMSSPLAIILKQTHDGWAVCLTDGRELAHFRGPGARLRAQRHLARCFSPGGAAQSARGSFLANRQRLPAS